MDGKMMAGRGDNLAEIRCVRCNRLLFKGQVDWVEIKCPKCRHCQVITRTGEGVSTAAKQRNFVR